MKIISYSDGEKIQILLAYEADLEECRERLKKDGFQIVKEDEMVEENVPCFGSFVNDERR